MTRLELLATMRVALAKLSEVPDEALIAMAHDIQPGLTDAECMQCARMAMMLQDISDRRTIAKWDEANK